MKVEHISNGQIEDVKGTLMSRFRNFAQTFIDRDYYDDKFHGELCDFLQDSGKNKMVILPRTFLKTTIISLYSLWKVIRQTGIRVLITSNTTPNAQKTVRSCRAIIEANEIFQLFFPEVIPDFAKVRWSDSCACINRKVDYPEGTWESAGVGTNIIRRHFNLIWEDDTVSPKKDELTGMEAMPSKDDIEKAVGFHKLTIPLLINEDDERIISATRWASYDLVNYVKENEKSFDIYEKRCWDEDGKPRYKRFSLNRLEDIKAGLGSHMFHMLYLNEPLAKEFMAFNPDWMKYYEEGSLPDDGSVTITIDPADPPTGKRTQDYTAIVSCLHSKKGIYLRRYRRKRLSAGQIIAEALDMADIDGALDIEIETNRYAHLEAGFKEEMAKRGKYYVIRTVKAKGMSKEARIKNRLSPLFENGVIYLKRGMRELEEELFTFPYSKHDDLIDALSWQIDRYHPTKYEKKVEKKASPIYNKFSFEQIRGSMERRGRTPYPFSVQNKDERVGVGSGRGIFNF